ncbi:hypothetical protein AURDEDRAFT_130790 [Auricularia subglabra TFB-10046 SS5]|uniref:Uncharacterized protein n=1 Tax=Auricularia subglabra (strain TFB-10046 / SS5) TaxID=717982 RepID=J0CWT8_AURST|nr:hypothetical protein AURDEDRAFT_130790 [Auricularia subglabra TFB-10046 SS5]
MIDGALLADNGRYIYVWPPDHSKPLRRNYDNIFRPRKAAANPKSETTSAHSNAPNSCKARTPTDVEAPMTSHELRESTTLWQSSRARLNVLSVFGVFGTGLAYSTYFQARSGDAPDSTVLSLLVASFVLYLFGTVGSIGLQLTFTEEKPLVFTYVHWLTLPLDFVTCVLMTGGTVMLTQAMAWTIVSGKAAFWFASAIMGVAPFATLWYPALILIVRNRGIVWPALCIAVGATPRKGSRLSQPEPVSLTKGEEPNHEARRFLDMYDQYGGALQYARKMLLPSLDWQNPIVRDPDTFQDLISVGRILLGVHVSRDTSPSARTLSGFPVQELSPQYSLAKSSSWEHGAGSPPPKHCTECPPRRPGSI